MWGRNPRRTPAPGGPGYKAPPRPPPAVPGPREGVYLSEPGGGARILPADPRRVRRPQWQLGSPSARVPSHAG